MHINKQTVFISLFLVMIIGLSNSGLHPVTGNGGYTGAPGDNTCNQCHSGGGSLNGDISISGLPSTIETNQTYNLEITINNPNGNAVRSGFQLVALNGSNGNAGSMSNLSPNTQLRTSGGKSYFGHSPAQNFPTSNTLTFNVDWTAPSTPGSIAEIKFYAASVIANGNGNTSGDLVVLTSEIVPITTSQDPISIDITASSDPLCFGENTGAATAEAMGGSGSYSYLWSDGSSGATNNNLSAGTHSVTATDTDGNTVSTSISLDNPDLLAATATAPTIPCDENTGEITIVANGGVGDYDYDIGGPSQSSNVFLNVPAGTYTFTTVDSNGCSVSDEIVLEANVAPTATATVNDVLTCTLMQVTVSGAGSSTGSEIAYLWTTQDGNILSGQNNLNAIVNEPGTYTLNVTHTDNGCVSEASVIVAEDISLPVISTTGGELDCGASEIQICATIENGHTVEWNINGQSSSETCVLVTTAGSYVATATGTNGCTASSIAIVTASVDLPTITISQPDTITCSLTNITLASTVGNGSNFAYNWTTNDGNILNGENTLTPEVNQAGTYTLNALNQDNNCSASSSIIVVSNTIAPVLTVEDAVLGCSNDTINISVVVAGGGPFEFNWTTIDGNITSGANSNVAMVDTSGVYQVVVRNLNNNCSSSTTLNVTEDFNDPNAMFTYTLMDNSFTGQASTTDENSTFLWDFGNGTTSTESNPIIQLDAGTYNVCLSVTNECGTLENCIEIVVEGSSSDEIHNISKLSIYPNPAREMVYLDINFTSMGYVTATLHSIDGTQLFSKGYYGDIKDNWDISQLATGHYTLSIVGESFTISRTIAITE